jgi:hypothetical protein
MRMDGKVSPGEIGHLSSDKMMGKKGNFLKNIIPLPDHFIEMVQIIWISDGNWK